MEGTVSVTDFIKYLEENGLVITHRSNQGKYLLKRRYLSKKSLTYKEIADAGIWGDIGKKAVETIAKAKVQDHEKFKDGNKYKIYRSVVERVSRHRGMWNE